MMAYKTASAYEFYNILFMVSLMFAIHAKDNLESLNTVSLFN